MVLYLTIVGVILTTVGAFFIGWNDIISEDKAIEMGLPYYPGTREENLKIPAVRELLRRNRNSRRGLIFVIVGAVFLILASLV